MLRRAFYIGVLAFVGTFFMSANVAKAQIVTDGLVSYWSFDRNDIEGKTVKDVFGKNNGTMVGNPKVVKGKMGDALEFNGATDYVEVPDEKSLQLWTTYTLEAWIFQMESRSSRIIDKITAGTADGPHLDTHPGTILRSCAGACISSNTQYKLETWHHVVQTFNEGDVQFYLNGNPDGGGKAPSPLSGNKLTLKIGADSDGRNLFKGIIDEVKVYNRAISAAQVKQNFTSKIGLAVNPTGKLATRWGEIKASR